MRIATSAHVSKHRLVYTFKAKLFSSFWNLFLFLSTMSSNDSHEGSYWPIRSTTSTERMVFHRREKKTRWRYYIEKVKSFSLQKNCTHCDCYWEKVTHFVWYSNGSWLLHFVSRCLVTASPSQRKEKKKKEEKEKEEEGVTRARLSLSKRASGRIRE